MASFCLRNFHSLYTPNCKRPRFNRTRRSVNILASWYFFLFDFTCFKLLWVFQYSARLWAPSLVRPIQSPLSFKTSSSTNTFPLPLTLSIPGLSLVCSRWNPFFRHGTHWRDQRSAWLIIFLLLFCKSRGEHLWLISDELLQMRIARAEKAWNQVMSRLGRKYCWPGMLFSGGMRAYYSCSMQFQIPILLLDSFYRNFNHCSRFISPLRQLASRSNVSSGGSDIYAVVCAPLKENQDGPVHEGMDMQCSVWDDTEESFTTKKNGDNGHKIVSTWKKPQCVEHIYTVYPTVTNLSCLLGVVNGY